MAEHILTGDFLTEYPELTEQGLATDQVITIEDDDLTKWKTLDGGPINPPPGNPPPIPPKNNG